MSALCNEDGVPLLTLDPDGRPIVVFDLQGDPRDLTVWGAVTAGPNVALVATDTDDPPASGDLMALADALNPERVDLLIEARAQTAAAENALAITRDQVADLKADLAVASEQVEALRTELVHARTAGRDTARRAVLALTRRTRRTR